MHYRIFGVLCIIIGCGGWGFAAAAKHTRLIRQLQQFSRVLEYMQCELQYRQTPLPQLCYQAAGQCTGKLRLVFTVLSEELDLQVLANAELCMLAAIDRCGEMQEVMRYLLCDMSRSLGKFDMNGQITELTALQTDCTQQLQILQRNSSARIRGYQTLGLCAGAAIAILFV